MRSASPRLMGGMVGLIGLAALAVAFASERLGGLVPCALCLVERWPWRIAILLGVLVGLLPPRPARLALALLPPLMLASVALGVVHVGVEQKAWPSPLPECAAPHLAAGSPADRLRAMPDRPSKPCDDPTYLIPAIPVSMAAGNLILSLLLGGGITIYLLRHDGSRR